MGNWGCFTLINGVISLKTSSYWFFPGAHLVGSLATKRPQKKAAHVTPNSESPRKNPLSRPNFCSWAGRDWIWFNPETHSPWKLALKTQEKFSMIFQKIPMFNGELLVSGSVSIPFLKLDAYSQRDSEPPAIRLIRPSHLGKVMCW